VQYKDGSTCDMTVQQYDYLKASAQAVADMDFKASADSQPAETPVPAEPAQNITESPDLRDGYVPEEGELPFEGSLTAYDDRAADTPALYANLPNVSNSFTAIMDWFGDTFFVERTETVHKSGYTSERYSYNSSTQLIQLPYEEDSTTTSQVLNPQACVSALLVVLVFVTTVTWIKNAIWGRMS
jgi:hypothetical protein